MPVQTVKKLVMLAAVLMAAGCLQPPDNEPASYYAPRPPQASPSAAYSPPVYQPIYQPPPLAPALAPQTAPIPAVGYSPPVRYAPPPAPQASLLVPAPAPSTSLFGPQRTDWKPGGGF